jgi:glycerate 2-kinase
MTQKYLIATQPLQNIPASEAASVVVRALRAADRTLKSDHVVQLPLVDGGEGTLEHLVTASLGSFLEVEVTDGSGEQAIVPFGLLGEENGMAFIALRSVAGQEAHPDQATAKKRRSKTVSVPTTGTTFGIGELIQDALDEGSRSILLGWEEPLVRDAGLGAAAALGVKFFDKNDKQLDLSKWDPQLLSQIHRIDGSGRSMEMLMARYYLMKSEALRAAEAEAQFSMEDSLFESELTRLAEIVKRDCGKDVAVSKIRMNGSGIDFGMQAFFDTTIEDGGAFALQVLGIPKMLEEDKPRLVIVAQTLEQVYGQRAPLASQTLLKHIKANELSFDLFLKEQPQSTALSRFRRSYRSLDRFMLLRDAKLFLPPVADTAEEERQNTLLRLEKIIGDSFSAHAEAVQA